MNILILGRTGAMGKYLTDILSADKNNKILLLPEKNMKIKIIFYFYMEMHMIIFFK